MAKARKAGWPANLTPEERAEAARAKMPAIIDQTTSLLALNEANRIVVYSNTLAGQIPQSRAANAFNVFQRSSFGFELVRLCALWDKPDRNRQSLPTIAALIEDLAVLHCLRRDIVSSWPDSPEYGAAQAHKLTNWCIRALAVIKGVRSSSRFRDLVNYRDKRLAHELSESISEANGQTFSSPRYGFESNLLKVSVGVTRRLHLAISNTDMDFRGSRGIARRNAGELWNACRFEIPVRR